MVTKAPESPAPASVLLPPNAPGRHGLHEPISYTAVIMIAVVAGIAGAALLRNMR